MAEKAACELAVVAASASVAEDTGAVVVAEDKTGVVGVAVACAREAAVGAAEVVAKVEDGVMIPAGLLSDERTVLLAMVMTVHVVLVAGWTKVACAGDACVLSLKVDLMAALLV